MDKTSCLDKIPMSKNVQVGQFVGQVGENIWIATQARNFSANVDMVRTLDKKRDLYKVGERMVDADTRIKEVLPIGDLVKAVRTNCAWKRKARERRSALQQERFFQVC